MLLIFFWFKKIRENPRKTPRFGHSSLHRSEVQRHNWGVSTALADPVVTPDVVALRDGVPGFSRVCLPKGSIQGRVVLSHGVSEHGGRYEHVMRAMAERGWASVIFDHRGHGRSSSGLLAMSPDMQLLADDLDAAREHLLSFTGPGPCVLWGHSMGGLVALLHLAKAQSQYQAAVLSAAATQIPKYVPRALVKFANRLAKRVPTLPAIRASGAEHLTRCPEMIERTVQDPLMYSGGMRVGTGAGILRGILQVDALAPRIRLPMLVAHGDQDKVMPVDASRELYRKLGSMDKTLRIYEGWLHELHNERDRVRYLKETMDWIDAQFVSATSQVPSSVTPGPGLPS